MPLRRAAKRKVNARRKRVMRAKRMARRRNPDGVIHLTRRIGEQNVYNTATAGVVAASSSTVIVGTPFQTAAFVGSSYYHVPFTIDFQLSDLVNYTELTAIADKYRINWIKVRAFCTSNTASAGGTSQLPSVLWANDQDDVVMPTSSAVGIANFREKMNSKVRQFKQNGGPLSWFIKPSLVTSVLGPAGTPAQSIISGPRFLDTATPDIPHFGLKGYLQDVNLAATPSVYTQFKFDITMGVTLKGIQ